VRRITWIRTSTVAAAGIAAAAVVVPTLTASAVTSPPKTPNRAAAAAGWLARQLTGANHDHYTITFGSQTFPNFGETADGVLSMDAAGVSHDAADRATSYLEKHVNDYAKGSPTYYPGATAKLILVATAQHVSPHAFGAVDLVKVLRQSEGAGGAAPGEFQQNPGFSGTSYIVSQALPVLALSIAPASAGADAASVSFLVGQQCADGGFMSTIRDDTTTPCTGEDVDSTGYAVQALFAAGAKTAALKGVGWLRRVQHADGGFGSPENSNSTALAVQALIAGHYGVHGAIAWIEKRQLGCAAIASRRGAITFRGTYDSSALLATSQAAAAIARRPLAWIDGAGAHAAAPVLDCG
jgi:hypothetical protein